MKKTLAITLAAFAAVATGIASPVRSDLGGSGESYIVGWDVPSATEYVQDNLVACWDAIENVAYGRHDSQATEWIDLVDGKVLRTTSTKVFWKKDCLYRWGDWLVGGTAYPTIDATYDGEWAIEVVVSLEGVSSIQQARSFISFSSFTIRVPNIAVDGTASVYLANIGAWAVAEAPFDRTAFTLVREGNIYSIYVNGELLYVKTDKNNRDWNPTSCLISQNLLSDAEGNQSTSDNCAIRVYNRALTSEEVAHNFALDAVRFGIE